MCDINRLSVWIKVMKVISHMGTSQRATYYNNYLYNC